MLSQIKESVIDGSLTSLAYNFFEYKVNHISQYCSGHLFQVVNKCSVNGYACTPLFIGTAVSLISDKVIELLEKTNKVWLNFEVPIHHPKPYVIEVLTFFVYLDGYFKDSISVIAKKLLGRFVVTVITSIVLIEAINLIAASVIGLSTVLLTGLYMGSMVFIAGRVQDIALFFINTRQFSPLIITK